MSNRSPFLPQPVADYLIETARESGVQKRLREKTASLPTANYQIAPEQGQLLALLVELLGARRILEIGAYTGYSALAMAQAMPEDGRLFTFDVSEEFTALAREAWAEAGLADRITLTLGPAEAGVQRLIEDGEGERFDLAFIDADKESYETYYEQALQLVRPGGLIALDNTLWRGRVADPEESGAKTRLFRRLNASIAADPRVTPALLPIGDGMTLARKR